MKENVIAIVEGIQCAEQKIKYCKAQKISLLAKAEELDSAIAYQEKSKLGYERALEDILREPQPVAEKAA